MKVIFLDVDGVLNSQQLFEKCEDDQLISVDEDNIKNLKTIVDATGAKIVLSSSWRYGWAEHSDAVQDWCQILVDILAKYDLKIIDKTEYLSSGRREDEIKDWLDKCEEKIEGFVILDDGAYEWHRHGFDKHLVKTDFCTGGLREEDADKAIKILNKKRLFSFFFFNSRSCFNRFFNFYFFSCNIHRYIYRRRLCLIRHTVFRICSVRIRTYRTICKQHIQCKNPTNDRHTAQQNQPTGFV